MNENNPWDILKNLKPIKRNYEEDKNRILNQNNKEFFYQMCFFYDGFGDYKLKSIAKPFNKRHYDEVQNFFTTIPTLRELNNFLDTIYTKIDGEIKSFNYEKINNETFIIVSFSSNEEENEQYIKKAKTISFFGDTCVRYKGEDFILTELMKKMHEE